MLDHVRARWACGELDRRIAEGDDLDLDRLLSLRAAQLVKPAARTTAASGLEGVVATVQKPRTPFSAAVPSAAPPCAAPAAS